MLGINESDDISGPKDGPSTAMSCDVKQKSHLSSPNGESPRGEQADNQNMASPQPYQVDADDGISSEQTDVRNYDRN